MGETILVTGGTGFVGRGVVAELRAAGLPVRVFSRSAPPPGFAEEWARGDVRDGAALRQAAAGCRTVVHLVGIRRQAAGKTFDEVVVRGTENAVEAARAAGCERFVLVSALGVDRGLPTGYMRTKAAVEAAVRASGLAYTVLRPSFVVGPGGFVEEYGRLILRAPLVPIPGDGTYPVQPVARGDLALAVRRALEVRAASGKTYDLPGPERVPFEGFVELIMGALGCRKRKVHLPAAVMLPIAAVLERLLPEPPATREELQMLLAGNVGDPGPAVRDLGLRLTPLAEAVRAAVQGLPHLRRPPAA